MNRNRHRLRRLEQKTGVNRSRKGFFVALFHSSHEGERPPSDLRRLLSEEDRQRYREGDVIHIVRIKDTPQAALPDPNDDMPPAA